MTQKNIKCCECGYNFPYQKDGGLRCELCAQEDWVSWLIRAISTIRTGEPDGHTPAMSQEQRLKHDEDVVKQKSKLRKLRKKYPERAKNYAEKNKGNYYGEAVEL